MSSGSEKSGPLKGVKVVEIAGIGPCPMCAMLLAEMGADVLKVDRMVASGLGIDISRSFLDRSRRSIAVDLKSAEGVAVVKRLVADADILIEGMRPGVMERLGLGPQDCAAVNPRLVFGRVTGWGQEGPLSQAAGHDLNYIAITGALNAVGHVGARPTPPLNLVGDYGGGALYLALGVVAALVEARQSGKGQVVDAAMIDGAASLMTAIYAMRASGVFNDTRGENILDSGAHFYDTYETSDGKYVSLAPIEAKFYAEFLERVGADAADLPQSYDRADWPALKDKVAAIMKGRTQAEWVEALEGTDVCFAPVLSMAEAPHHPHNTARDTFVERDGDWQPNAAPRFSRTPATVTSSPARPGEHTSEALADWGFGREEIDRLLEEGVVGQLEG